MTDPALSKEEARPQGAEAWGGGAVVLPANQISPDFYKLSRDGGGYRGQGGGESVK